jgi:uncharacterized membrane protein YbaN (DUF454 family)
MELSQSTKNLIEKYILWNKSLRPKEGLATIHVDEVASKVASFYEQIRTVIDWKEEHLMRRAAIIRKLKRRFLDLELSDFSTENIAEPLVLELVRGGYFPNDRIEESKISGVKKIVDKYVFILKNSPDNKKGKVGLRFYGWLLEIAACEIEEMLSPSIKEMSLIDYMFEEMKAKIRVDEEVHQRNLLKKEETDVQIYIAVQRALFKLDDPIISYNLIKYKYPYWESPSEEELLKISQNIFKIWHNIESDLSHIISKKFYTICEKYDTPYLLLGDILLANSSEKTAEETYHPPMMENLIKEAYGKRLIELRAKIRRAAIYSTLSIFITKILSLIVLEAILAKIIFNGQLNYFSLAADVLIPTGLMATLVASIRPPSNKNLNLAVMETMKIVYQKDKKDIYEIKTAKKRSLMTRLALSLIYLLGAVISFGFIFWVFDYFQFPITSIIINFIFIALILFAGTAVRKRSRELNIEEEYEGFLGFISDVLFLPITDAGRWLSNTWKQYNAISAFFNALIDMPFSAFVEFLERWRYFLKEKKEELR